MSSKFASSCKQGITKFLSVLSIAAERSPARNKNIPDSSRHFWASLCLKGVCGRGSAPDKEACRALPDQLVGRGSLLPSQEFSPYVRLRRQFFLALWASGTKRMSQ